ncbi:ATP-dependent RNA helicase [Sulfurimonas gotlandica GD1]|uniref:ATP-dependent RNA helicase n=1 Tax=Sulfurimonas gotlandica (strain DSM 19862 / JCM 16533 / GD1) TaxID=929558 RepID=B6BNA7_SULGG|nr:ATP-dependent helicase HrpB [Sulfurimonas gotlandica]EDZ61388.1 ATP-dependent helicase HrpB [Sulfurimonas gotlandica GD1]EHP30977.1 ATP-dependent RNA helicase [Sulfurimonas gotlandica GD1]
MQNLPINQVLPQVKKELLTSNRLVLQAPPGAGKTTALPLALLDEAWLKDKIIIMLEPRRLAVRSCASRMAELLGEKVGERIGYQIKMESVKSKKTKILIVTEGILTRKLQADPSLEDVALVIFDEFHERSIHADLSLALSLESQSLIREDLKILVMSATLNTHAICGLLENAPLIESEGRSYPVESIYLDAKTKEPTKREFPTFASKLITDVLKSEDGNMLVFLPGIAEIKKTQMLINETLKKTNNTDIFVSSLYGNLSKEEQDRAIKAPPKGKRKIVLATNIAQTSLTIEGIKIVIDSGLANSSVFNSSSGMNKLQSSFISQDSATQRAGRAGRLSAGKCYHLWHKGKILLKHDKPEILSTDLTQMLLELSLWGNEEISELRWMDLPPEGAMIHAKELLFELGAIDANAKITKHGKEMCSFGVHPRLAHMMIKAKEMQLSYEASLVCVLIQEKDIYTSSYRSSDIRERVSVLHDVSCGIPINASHIDIKNCKFLLQSASKIEKRQKCDVNLEMIGVLLALAYPERVSKRREKNSCSYLLANKKGAYLHQEDELFDSEYLVICDLDARGDKVNGVGREGTLWQNALIYKAASIDKSQIELYLKENIETKESLSWNSELQRVEARKRSYFGSIVINETQMQSSSNEEVSKVLLDGIRESGLDSLAWTKDSLGLRHRINFVNAHKALKMSCEFPDFCDEHLLDTMDEWLLPYIEGKNSLKSLSSLNLYSILSGLLTWEQMQSLDALAPAKIQVASGSNIFIDYSDADKPILAVRLQEMFGTQNTPAVLNGKVKLMIHLLSPASKPMQITQDLESFWANTYDDVKKELRGKYKRHYWPDDPLTAQATSKTKKNMHK